ncbi:MAG: hypothetical protein N3A61_06035, partial [Ignavibacteria bacterium]|nr:hypothetical protein [Ignavibacteria bacterium]
HYSRTTLYFSRGQIEKRSSSSPLINGHNEKTVSIEFSRYVMTCSKLASHHYSRNALYHFQIVVLKKSLSG